jgi:hypothetical protein
MILHFLLNELWILFSSMQEINEHDFNDGDIHSPYNQQRLGKEREKVRC